MLRTRHITTLLTLLVLALPASAMAQGSAGQDQYQDPFGNSTGGGTTHRQVSPGNGGNSSQSPIASSSGVANGSSSSSSTGTSSSTGKSSGSQAEAAPSLPSGSAPGQLPRTGMNAWLEALGGVVLLAAGLGLRLRARSVT